MNKLVAALRFVTFNYIVGLSLVWLPLLATAENILLKDSTLTKSETLIDLEIFSEDKSMGNEIEPIRKVRQGSLTLGKPIVGFIPPNKNNHFPQGDVYLVIIPFSIHPLPDGRHYEKVEFSIDLNDHDAIARDLFPKDILQNEHTRKSYTISSQLKIVGIDGAVDGNIGGGIEEEYEYEKLHPILTAYGLGESHFYWIFEKSLDNEGVVPRTQHLFILLEVPNGQKTLTGEIDLKAKIANNLFPKFINESKTDPFRLTIDLKKSRIHKWKK